MREFSDNKNSTVKICNFKRDQTFFTLQFGVFRGRRIFFSLPPPCVSFGTRQFRSLSHTVSTFLFFQSDTSCFLLHLFRLLCISFPNRTSLICVIESFTPSRLCGTMVSARFSSFVVTSYRQTSQDNFMFFLCLSANLRTRGTVVFGLHLFRLLCISFPNRTSLICVIESFTPSRLCGTMVSARFSSFVVTSYRQTSQDNFMFFLCLSANLRIRGTVVFGLHLFRLTYRRIRLY